MSISVPVSQSQFDEIVSPGIDAIVAGRDLDDPEVIEARRCFWVGFLGEFLGNAIMDREAYLTVIPDNEAARVNLER